MLNPNAFANSAAAGVAVLEAVPEGDVPSPLRFVPLRRTTINGRWDGPLAEITVTHTYGYTRAQCDQVLEAVYRFPLPGDAAVRRVMVTFGDSEIVAELKARHEAERDYAEAKRTGRQATLTTRESPDAFTLRVAGLQPEQDIVVETTYVQLADADGIGWALRIPLTAAPRYTRPDEIGTPAADGQPLATYRDPGHRFSLDLITTTAGTITSATHVLCDTREDEHIRVQLAQTEMIPDRDCVLHWEPEQANHRPILHVLTGDDPDGGHTYFAAMVSPPAVSDQRTAPILETIVLVDHSGSMNGAKREAADRAALRFVGSLSTHDRVNVGVFDSNCRWFRPGPERVAPDTSDRVDGFLNAERDGRGTNLGMALEQALLQRRNPGEVSRQVVVVTDAQVSDEARILSMVEREGRRSDRRRVSVLCIDAAPNSYLTQQLALVGGGIARFLTSDPNERDMAQALETILQGWTQPVAVGLALQVNRGDVEISDGRQATSSDGWHTVDLGDLTMGRSLWIVGRVPSEGATDLTFRLDGPPTKGVSVPAGALKAIFGAYRVLGLERLVGARVADEALENDLRRLGYDPVRLRSTAPGATSIYPENARRAMLSALKTLLLSEALAYGLLCSVTGFVAVRKEEGRTVRATALVGNALPSGWSDKSARAQSPMPRAERIMLRPALRADDMLAPLAESPIQPRPRLHREQFESLLRKVARIAEYEHLISELGDLRRTATNLTRLPDLCNRLTTSLGVQTPQAEEAERAIKAAIRSLGTAMDPMRIFAREALRRLADRLEDLSQTAIRLIRECKRRPSRLGMSRQEAAEAEATLEAARESLHRSVRRCTDPNVDIGGVLHDVRQTRLALQSILSQATRGQ